MNDKIVISGETTVRQLVEILEKPSVGPPVQTDILVSDARWIGLVSKVFHDRSYCRIIH